MQSAPAALSGDAGPPRAAVETPEYSVHLDAIRGAAASIVFLSHIRLLFLSKTAATPLHTIASTAVRGGSEVRHNPDYAHHAVMVFFVLSGFLVGGSVVRAIQRGNWSWKKYLVHRMVRLWMVLIPALFLVLVLDRTALHFFAGQETLYSAPARQDIIRPHLESRLNAATFLGNMFFLQEIRVTPLGTNQPLWSLANEFWYYLAFPLVALIFFRRLNLLKTALALGLLGGMSWFVGVKISIYFVIWLLGVFAAVLPWKFSPRLRWPLIVAAAAGFLGIDVLTRIHGLTLIEGDMLIGAVSFLLFYAIAQLRDPFPAGPYRAAAHFMSKISYSLYLTHASVLIFMSALLVGTWKTLPLNGHNLLLVVTAVATAFGIACTVHFLFEARTNQVRDYLEAKLLPAVTVELAPETVIAEGEALSPGGS